MATRRKSPVLTVVGAPAVTWLDWYNQASASAQEEFDRKASAIDGRKEVPDSWFQALTDVEMRNALLNYRDTGGRRGLFAPKETNFGSAPISVVKPGGPIESIGQVVVLHPGRYSYSHVTADGDAFPKWLDAARETKNVSSGGKQVSEAVLAGKPFYTDYEFWVWKDAVWSPTIKGLPTWLPKDYSLESYWGKPTPSAGPDLSVLKPAFDVGKTIVTLAVVAAAVWMVGELRPRQIGSAR